MGVGYVLMQIEDRIRLSRRSCAGIERGVRAGQPIQRFMARNSFRDNMQNRNVFVGSKHNENLPLSKLCIPVGDITHDSSPQEAYH